jgi:hypothetical protein
MTGCKKQSLSWVFVKGMMGVICFLIIVILVKILTHFTTAGGIFQKAAEGILFANFWLLLLITIILFIADIFWAFPFPLNLPAPIIRAFGSVFCIAFVLSVFQWVDSITGTTLYQFFWVLAFLVVPLVFLIVLAGGYFEIMRQLWWQPKLEPASGAQVVHEDNKIEADQPVSDAKSWEEIGAEFRMMLYDIIHRFRQEIKRNQ